MKFNGVIASIGLAASHKLDTTVMPFILRGAMQTLRAHKPVVFCRLQTKAWKYGFEDDDIDRMLEKEGYAVKHEEVADPFPFKVFACQAQSS